MTNEAQIGWRPIDTPQMEWFIIWPKKWDDSLRNRTGSMWKVLRSLAVFREYPKLMATNKSKVWAWTWTQTIVTSSFLPISTYYFLETNRTETEYPISVASTHVRSFHIFHQNIFVGSTSISVAKTPPLYVTPAISVGQDLMVKSRCVNSFWPFLTASGSFLTPVAQEAEDLLSKFSNDELCVCWRAFDRLQLLDRAMLLKLGGRVRMSRFLWAMVQSWYVFT